MDQFIHFIMVIPRLIGRLHPVLFLFSKKWGIVWSTPLIFLGIIGFFIFTAREIRNRWPYLLGLILSSFFTIGMDAGSAYGFRYFLTNLTLCILGLALIMDYLFQKNKGWIAILLIGISALWQYISVIQYRITLGWDNPEYTFEVLPVLYRTIQEGLFYKIMLRPLSWLSMVVTWGFKIQSPTDAFFLIGIPLLFIFFLFLPLALQRWELFRKTVNRYVCRKSLLCSFCAIGFFLTTDAVLLIENPSKTDSEKALNHRIAGQRYLEKKDFTRAYRHLKTAKILDSDDIEATRLLGHAFFYLDSLSQSEQAFQEIIENNRENYWDYMYLTATKLRQGANRESVVPLLMKALEMARDDPEETKILLEQIKSWGFDLNIQQ